MELLFIFVYKYYVNLQIDVILSCQPIIYHDFCNNNYGCVTNGYLDTMDSLLIVNGQEDTTCLGNDWRSESHWLQIWLDIMSY